RPDMYRPRSFAALTLTLCVLAAVCTNAAHSDIFIDRDLLTVSNNNITATFRGPDLIRLTNNQTQEGYLRPPAPFRTTLDFGLVEPTGRPLQWDFWRKGKVEAAQLVLKDLTRTITM